MTDPVITNLWQRFFREELDPGDKEALAKWIEQEAKEEEITALLEEAWHEFQPEGTIPHEEADAMLAVIMSRTKDKTPVQAPVISMKTKWWKRAMLAASVLIIMGVGVYFLFFNSYRSKPAVITSQELPDDIQPPATNRATITLADGHTLFLDSAASGALTMQQQVQLSKLADGRIIYSGSATELVCNTLNNPRGSKVIDMLLADGSHVWLNAGSSLTYPVAFVGNERKVFVTGEAYFEVAHDAAKPFYVSKGDMTVQVLGTHFNVNAYDDEREIRVTLLEGSVEVKNKNAMGRIKPGQQAIVQEGIDVSNKIDTEEVMAWKNGNFRFGGVSIGKAMREISRWYDVEVVYEDEAPGKKLHGDISRDVPVSKVCKMLEATGGAHFRLEGKKLYVTQ